MKPAGLVSGIMPCKDPYDVAEGADALIIMTEWNQFRNLDFERLKRYYEMPIFIDLRNVYDPIGSQLWLPSHLGRQSDKRPSRA